MEKFAAQPARVPFKDKRSVGDEPVGLFIHFQTKIEKQSALSLTYSDSGHGEWKRSRHGLVIGSSTKELHFADDKLFCQEF